MKKIAVLSLFRKGEQFLEGRSNSVGISRCSPSGRIGYAISALLLVFGCSPAEALGPPLGEHTEQSILIRRGEAVPLHEPLSNSVHHLNALPPAVATNGKMVADKVAGPAAHDAESGHDAGIVDKEARSGSYPIWWHLACILAFGLTCVLAGFFFSYPYSLRTRQDWTELWRDVKYCIGI
jgi:hypothetical protein